MPRVVGQTDAGETIYQVRSARLVLRADAAHFNRLVTCSKCGREVVGRAVLGAADLDQPARPVVCGVCAEVATASSVRSEPPVFSDAGAAFNEPVAVDEPALADAQAEMDGRLEVSAGRGEPVDEGADDDAIEPVEDEVSDVVEEAETTLHVEGEQPAVVAVVLGEDEERDEDEMSLPVAPEAVPTDAVLDAEEFPAEPLLTDSGLGDDEPLTAVEPSDTGVDVDEEEPPAPEPEPVAQDEGDLDEEAPALIVVDLRPDDVPILRPDAPEDLPVSAGVGADPLRMAALEETIQRLAERADAQASVQRATQARLDELATALEAAQGKKDTDKLRRRLDQMGERLERMQGTIDAEWARAKSETATLGQALTDLGERVLRLAEQAGDAVGADDERLSAVEERLDEVAGGVARALDAQRAELQEGLRDGLADVLSAIPSPAAAADDSYDTRIRALERQIQQSRGEVSELNELHAALDAGLGSLRGELGEIRTGLSRLADSKADLDDRLETFVRMSLVPEGEKGRKAKKAAESTMGTLSAAVQDLIREQRQLKDTVANLEQLSDAATAAAARASMQVSSLGPLRSDVKLLHQELVEQQDSLEEMRRTVERLRQRPSSPTPPSPQRPAAKAAKAPAPAPAAKATPPARKAAPAKKAAAKAALARAAADAAKAAPAAKRPPRAKKA